MKQSTRAYWYRVVTAAIPILTAYGLISDQRAPLFVGLAGALFTSGLAAVNTSTKG